MTKYNIILQMLLYSRLSDEHTLSQVPRGQFGKSKQYYLVGQDPKQHFKTVKGQSVTNSSLK